MCMYVYVCVCMYIYIYINQWACEPVKNRFCHCAIAPAYIIYYTIIQCIYIYIYTYIRISKVGLRAAPGVVGGEVHHVVLDLIR